MNFKGLGPYKWKYKLNRPLTDEERKNHLDVKSSASREIDDDLSVIRLNSTYLELVDRWYADKGHAVIYGALGASPMIYGVVAGLQVTIEKIDHLEIALFGIVASAICFAILVMFLWFIHLEAFRRTHYPIRLNRKARMVYAFKPNGSVIRASWDHIFFCKDSHYVPLMGRRFYDIRAHILGEDGLTVRETFTLGYPYFGDEERLPLLWEYIRSYMEDDKGVKKNYEATKLCMPVGERREGLYFGVVRGFGIAAFSPFIAQALMSPIWAVITWGRLIAMYTSRVPRWPQEIQAECRVDESDPYRKDWHDNKEFSFIEGPWPMIWFVIGSAVAALTIYWTIASMVNAM
ncbi:MAG: hypothetical protein CMN25_09415 [Salinicola sp.]|uniref:DUF6708 domain-containing protein n=1 Tax=uncultured Salinicola sp. TaxID=1193542 RepID=UPI000C93C9A0|nr:DUF6708 domain-containing protein [uncultured Salinicola sp.]MAM57538.1 hypothetical protein [Salinicola sp.]|tara:strand:- start:7175 stop:8215 length:1041 start_codon:yes stop_codon:yes gene_type:complete